MCTILSFTYPLSFKRNFGRDVGDFEEFGEDLQEPLGCHFPMKGTRTVAHHDLQQSQGVALDVGTLLGNAASQCLRRLRSTTVTHKYSPPCSLSSSHTLLFSLWSVSYRSGLVACSMADLIICDN